jgi:hypothetical protein
MFIDAAFLEINSRALDNVCDDLLVHVSDLRVRHLGLFVECGCWLRCLVLDLTLRNAMRCGGRSGLESDYDPAPVQETLRRP